MVEDSVHLVACLGTVTTVTCPDTEHGVTTFRTGKSFFLRRQDPISAGSYFVALWLPTDFEETGSHLSRELLRCAYRLL